MNPDVSAISTLCGPCLSLKTWRQSKTTPLSALRRPLASCERAGGYGSKAAAAPHNGRRRSATLRATPRYSAATARFGHSALGGVGFGGGPPNVHHWSTVASGRKRSQSGLAHPIHGSAAQYAAHTSRMMTTIRSLFTSSSESIGPPPAIVERGGRGPRAASAHHSREIARPGCGSSGRASCSCSPRCERRTPAACGTHRLLPSRRLRRRRRNDGHHVVDAPRPAVVSNQDETRVRRAPRRRHG
jgi:hypothetical protein